MKKSALKTGLFAALLILVFSADAFAAEPGNWRPTYNFIMLWVNFSILAGLIAKFGWGPLTRWLKGQGEEVAAQLESMERQKKAIEDQMAQTREQIQNRAQYLDELMARVTETARMDKENMIELAHAQSRQMIEDAKKRADYKITEAQNTFREELIEEAVILAAQTLPQVISSEDESRFQTLFLDQVMQ